MPTARPPAQRPLPGSAPFSHRDGNRPGISQAIRVSTLLALQTTIGIVGFRLISGAAWIDCLYMTVITLSTVGFEHVIEPDTTGKIFISAYLAAGLGVFTYSTVTLGQFVVSEDIRNLLEKRRMDRNIGRLTGHHIVCGFGRMGRLICEELESQQAAFVAVDREPDALIDCRERGWLFLVGDATDDDMLRQAGIDRAASVAAALPADADNVYVALSARMLSEEVRIVARATEEKAAEKLRRAGADRVVSPLASGALKVARFLVSPGTEDFLDVTSGRGEDLSLADVRVPEGSPLAGLRLDATDFRRRGLIVLCIRRPDGEQLVPPPPTADIRPGDLLFLFGTSAAVRTAVAEICPDRRG